MKAPIDGVSLARTVRDVAEQARRALKRPAESTETLAVLEAIESLEADSRGRHSPELSRWLSSLRRRVEKHAGHDLS